MSKDTGTRPLRTVVKTQRRDVREGLLGGDTSRRVRIWELWLDCGHSVERPCKYQPRKSGSPRANGWHPRSTSDVLPAPARARCDYCPTA